MFGIVDYKISVGDLILAFVFALVADRIFKITPWLWSFLSDVIAKRSSRSRQKKIKQLEKISSDLEILIGDKTVLIIKSITELGATLILGLWTIILTFLQYMLMLQFSVNKIISGLHLENTLDWISYSNQIVPDAVNSFIVIVLLFINLVNFILFTRSFRRFYRYRHPEIELARLKSRINALTDKNA